MAAAAASAASGEGAAFALDETVLATFDKGSTKVEELLATTGSQTSKLKELAVSMSETTEPEKERALEAAARDAVKSSHLSLQSAKALLTQMNKRAALLERGDAASQAMAQVCLPRYRALLQRYMLATTENQQAKMAFKDVAVDRMVTQARGMPQFDHVTSDEELREQWERDPELISKAINRTAHGAVRAEYAMAQQKQADVKAILRDIEEVATMSREIAELVEMRSEAVHKIVGNIDVANSYVKQGTGRLQRALQHQRAARRRMCCLAIIVVVVLLILSGVLGGVLGTA